MKYAARLACMLACMLTIILARLALDQWQGYQGGIKNLKNGDYRNAIMYFDRVLNAHIPFSPFETRAKAHLLAIAAKYEGEHEQELALLCYETIRTSRYLTRHFWIPDEKNIPFLNDKIATIKAQLLVKEGMVRNFREGFDQQMYIMNKDYSPSVFWSLIVVASFLAYIGFIVLWIFDRKRVYIPLFTFAFILWLTGLYFA